MTKTYICPSCGRKQSEATQWQECSIAYEFDLSTGESEEVECEPGNTICWNCPECGEDLPYELGKRIEEMLGWYDHLK